MKKRILTLILVFTVAMCFSFDLQAASRPARVKSVTCSAATTKTLTIKFPKAKGAKQYQIRYKQAGKRTWTFVKFKQGLTLNTKKRSVNLKNLKKATGYYVQVRGIRGTKTGKWSKTKKIYTPYIKITLKDTNGKPVAGGSFIISRSGKSFTAKTNSKGIAITGLPVGKYSVKVKSVSGYVSITNPITTQIKKGKGSSINWTVKKKSSNTCTEPSQTEDLTDWEDLTEGYFTNNPDDQSLIKRIVNWSIQTHGESDMGDYDVWPWAATGYDENGNPYSSFDIGDEIIKQAKNKYGISQNSTDFEKALYVAQTICDLYSYDYTYTGEHYAEHKIICAQYAGYYQYALNKLGVPCYGASSIQDNHAWNIIKINGYYYNVDLTFMDREGVSESTSSGVIEHNIQLYDRMHWFLKSDSAFIEHTIVPNGCPIRCTNTKYDAFDWSDYPYEARYWKKWVE